MKLSSIIAARNRVAPPQDLLFTVDASIDQGLDVRCQFQLNYSGVIDWGDGSSNTVLSGTGNGTKVHNFPTGNTFQVKVSGTQVPYLRLYSEQSVVSVENLGNVGLQVTRSMFERCINLTSANLGNYITSIEQEAFHFCTSLTSVNIPNSVTSIGLGAFYDCTSLPSIIIPNSVTSIGVSAFGGCDSLSSIIIPNGVTSIELQTFINCSDLTSAIIPSGVTSIGDRAFQGCDSLSSIIIPDNVTSIGDDAFFSCTSLGSISCLAMSAPTLGGGGTGPFYNVNTSTIEVPIGATGYGTMYGNLTVNYVL